MLRILFSIFDAISLQKIVDYTEDGLAQISRGLRSTSQNQRVAANWNYVREPTLETFYIYIDRLVHVEKCIKTAASGVMPHSPFSERMLVIDSS